MKKRIAIIGAGMSGLVTGRFLKDDGHEIVIFEKASELGGVWAPSRRYPGVTTQNTKDTYAFSDFPMPDHFDERPTGEQMLEYLKSYADLHDLMQRIRFDTEVKVANPHEAGWHLTFQKPGDENEMEEEFDFLIVCNGIYCKPNTPPYPGQHEFEQNGGEVFHSTSFHDLEQVKGRKVLVVGFAKSACDIATEVSEVADETSLLFRHGNYQFPRYILGRHVNEVFFARFSGMFFPYWRKAPGEKLLHSWLGKPFLLFYWWMTQKILRNATGLDRVDIFPEGPIQLTFNCTSPLSPEGFFEKIKAGTIRAEKGIIERFTSKGVVLQSGEVLAVDRVILATGFRKETPFFGQQVERDLHNEKGRPLNFRNILPLNISNLLFNGYNSSIFTQLTAEIAAVWMSEYIAGRLELPGREEMLAQIEQLHDDKDRNRPENSADECVLPFAFQYIEDLLLDMRLPIRRTGSFRADWFKPIQSADYAGLKEDLNRRYGSAASG